MHTQKTGMKRIFALYAKLKKGHHLVKNCQNVQFEALQAE